MLAYIWWMVGAALVVAEMTTGTFYLLILGVSALIAGLLAWFGFILEIQGLAAIIIASLGCFGVSRYRATTPQRANPTQTIDVGRKVSLVSRNGADLRVHYRGTEWDAELVGDSPAELPAVLYIVESRNNILIVSPHAPV